MAGVRKEGSLKSNRYARKSAFLGKTSFRACQLMLPDTGVDAWDRGRVPRIRHAADIAWPFPFRHAGRERGPVLTVGLAARSGFPRPAPTMPGEAPPAPEDRADDRAVPPGRLHAGVPAWRAALVALVACGVALLLRAVLAPLLGSQPLFLLAYPASVVAAWYGGFLPGAAISSPKGR